MSELKIPFKGGPSRERLFDCLRLGQESSEFRKIEVHTDSFVFKGKTFEPFSWGIEIEGIHRADKVGQVWFFFGRQSHVTLRHTVHDAPLSNDPRFRFVLGKLSFWRQRSGFVTFNEQSFFMSPLTNSRHPDFYKQIDVAGS